MVEFSKIVKKNKKSEGPPETGPAEAKIPAETEPRSSAPQVPPVSEEPAEDAVKEAQENPQQEFPRIDIKPLFTQKFHQRPQTTPSESEGLGFLPTSPMESPAASVESPDANQQAVDAYESLFGLARQIFRKDVTFESLDTKGITEIVTKAARVIAERNQKIIELAIAYVDRKSGSYLFQHSTNVCILSLMIGADLRYEPEKLSELGLSAFLHDIGMVYYEDMVEVPRKLTQKEFNEIKKHVEAGEAILKRMGAAIGETIIAVNGEIHERLDGSGYPQGKKVIHDFARIIALVDAFESMIHPRSYRPRYSTVDVYKRIVDSKEKFDQNLIRILIDNIGFFPNGSYVTLNTKETGLVIGQNPRSPLRPVIRIIYGVNGQQLTGDEVKLVDLAKLPTIHIKDCFLEDINVANP